VNASAIIPVKQLDKAKTRLSSLLSNNERREFCLEMLEDVLVAVTTSKCSRRTVVVSVDPTVLEVAKRFGVFSLIESRLGLNQAVSEAIDWCVQNGAKSTLILPADIPSVKPIDLARIFSLGKEAAMVISPSRSEDGTNALLLTPPNILPTFYGKHSFQRYIMEA
jgi:2-phospho-L-lactate guanylyltransferase